MSETLMCPECGKFLVDEFGKCWTMNRYAGNKADILCYHCGKSLPFSIYGKIPVSPNVGYSQKEAREKWTDVKFTGVEASHG